MIPELSIVIPVRNESPNIKPLYDELTQTLGQYGRSYELLIIDDHDLVAPPELAHGLGQFVI